jgi:integrase
VAHASDGQQEGNSPHRFTTIPGALGSLRRRVLVAVAAPAGLTGVGFRTLRHTCASIIIESGLSPLRLRRWMGHHSPAFTLETYGTPNRRRPGDPHRELRRAWP